MQAFRTIIRSSLDSDKSPVGALARPFAARDTVGTQFRELGGLLTKQRSYFRCAGGGGGPPSSSSPLDMGACSHRSMGTSLFASRRYPQIKILAVKLRDHAHAHVAPGEYDPQEGNESRPSPSLSQVPAFLGLSRVAFRLFCFRLCIERGGSDPITIPIAQSLLQTLVYRVRSIGSISVYLSWEEVLLTCSADPVGACPWRSCSGDYD